MTVFVGDILNATPATVVANPPSTRTWRWLRNGVAIPGFTSTSYRVTGLDTGAPIAVQQVETNLMGSSSAVSVNTANVGAWTPSTIFSASEPGVWYDTDDYTAMFQDSAGTTPVTGAGQPVGLLLDKSKGPIGPELITNGDFATDTAWTKETGWTINGGFAVATAAAVSSELSQAITVVEGSWYQIEVTATITSGSIVARLYQSGEFVQSPVLASGSNRFILQSGTSGAGTAFTNTIAFAPLGTFTGTIDNVSVKEVPGNHATSSGDSRPRTVIRPLNAERRNLLTRTEEFNDVAWTKTNATITINDAIAPDGTMTAERLVLAGGTSGQFYRSVDALAGPVTTSIYIRADAPVTVSFGFYDGTSDVTTVSVTTSWQRVSRTRAAGLTSPDRRVCWLFESDASPATVYIWGAQFEAGSSVTDYQKVVTTNEWYDPAVPSYRGIQFDGVDDFLVTPTITPGTDKVQVFAGVRKLSDTARAMVVEISTVPGSSIGTFAVFAPDQASPNGDFAFYSRGTTAIPTTIRSGTDAAPSTRVITGIGDIAADNTTLRLNGVQVAQTSTDQGAGNYLAYQMYIGRRAGTTLQYNGILTSLVVRFGPNLSTSNINRAEYYVSEKTGVTLT